MTPPFSWRTTLRALRHPGLPPPALPGAALALLVPCAAAVGALIWFGHAWHADPHWYFGERKVGTYLSFLNLIASGVVSALIAGRLRPAPVTRFWWTASIGFLWMACDDLFVLHERIDRGVHALLGLDPDDPVTDHLDDLIVAGYGLAAAALGYRYRAQLVTFRWMLVILAVAFALFVAMVVLDFFHLSKALEDALKVVAGTLILVGVLAAWFETTISGRGGRHPSDHRGERNRPPA